MPDNRDIDVFGRQVHELSSLTPEQLEDRPWEALLSLNAVYSAAPPGGVAAAPPASR